MPFLHYSFHVCLLAIALTAACPPAHGHEPSPTCSMLGDAARTLAFHNQQVARAPKSPEVLTSRGFFHLNQNRRDLALRDFDRAIELAPGDPARYVARGLVYLETGDRGRAHADFSEACSLGDSSGCSFSKDLSNQ